MMRVAFVGALASSFADRVRAHVDIPCEFVHTDEKSARDVLPGADVVVTLVLHAARWARRRSGSGWSRCPEPGWTGSTGRRCPRGPPSPTSTGTRAGIAEYVLGAMIALSRDFRRVDTSLRAGLWDSQWAPGVPPPPVWPELAGRTLAILGYGGIGQAVARRARAFDMRIAAIRRDIGRSAGDDLVFLGDLTSLPALLPRADYLAISLPLAPETRGLIGAGGAALMKPAAILVNVSRAQIVDEDALYSALAEQRIAGAALDVWYRYPSVPGSLLPAARPFHELPNVLMTPHVSGWTDGMLEARATLIAENIRRAARGERPENEVPVAPAPVAT